MNRNDYARAGLVGVGTPQANPTVEAEFRIMLPPQVGMAVVRLTSGSERPEDRLREYLERLDATLQEYDVLRPDAFGFACTGSSYIVGKEAEDRILTAIQGHFDFPIITATAAIAKELDRINARRIAIASPYPPSLVSAAVTYWESLGYQVVDLRRIAIASGDTRGIYDLGSADARTAVDDLATLATDAVLLSGTGMPSLPLIADPPPGPPLLSSNACLASALCAALGLERLAPRQWHGRLAEALMPSKGPTPA
ncbi:MAG TPA: hypothetical protein VFO69_11175 [Allosphingosinicella sp.]|nr:hypothetical protein [Allosphingosinicella sp.]